MVKNNVIKKTEYDKLVAKVNGIDNQILSQGPNTKKMGHILKIKSIKSTKKIPDVINLVKKTDFNTKVTEIEGKIPDISGLPTKSALTVVENKIPDVSSLVKKIDFNTKVTEIMCKIADVSNLIKKDRFQY